MPDADVIVIGAGPAGLSAATVLASSGVNRVLVLEREGEVGGVPRHCGHYPFGLRENHRLQRGPAYAVSLQHKARAVGVDIRTGVSVKGLLPGPQLTVSSDAGVETLQARHVLLCTGVRESTRVQRLIGGTKPGGVLSTGALQAMVYLKHLRPFSRPVILGTELVSFSAILTCRHVDIEPVVMLEPGNRPVARWPAALLPKALGIPLLINTQVLAVEGGQQVESVVIRTGTHKARSIKADGIILSGNFRPDSSLLEASHLRVDPGTGGAEVDQYGRCSDPDYFAAGNLLRPVETAGWSWAEGRAVAHAMLGSLAGQLPLSDDRCRLTVAGDALRFAVPQRLADTNVNAALPAFQLRVNRAVNGHVDFSHEGVRLASRALTTLPERRITIDIGVIPEHIRGMVKISVRERST